MEGARMLPVSKRAEPSASLGRQASVAGRDCARLNRSSRDGKCCRALRVGAAWHAAAADNALAEVNSSLLDGPEPAVTGSAAERSPRLLQSGPSRPTQQWRKWASHGLICCRAGVPDKAAGHSHTW